MTSAPLEARGLVKTYGDQGVATRALAGVDLVVAPGESVAIMGPSGSGKTTLLHVLAGVLAPTSGSVLWRGQDLTTLPDRARTQLRRSDFGFVFQAGQLLPELPADENAALPLLLAGTPRPTAIDTSRRWLAHLGLAGMERRRPGELSGGQAQRVAIARALVGRPGVVFADEPTGALDRHTGWEVMQALTTATRAQGASLVVVTHDEEVAHWCSRTVHMRDGLIVAEAHAQPVAPAAGVTAAGATASAAGTTGPASPTPSPTASQPLPVALPTAPWSGAAR
ncbi:ABC transporter ATP-binding protein [Miniimonas arenae]|uniref:ABC transporter ATP-binding protein n=1 Tax=Miniimonas arenae TaxID=676201 RepID=A0A5C5B8G2_9MICO|nr:ABC transporter ATP-binding protein [Miniimonas arenae]TNU73273.1 ABC transporter ATP-binding protein [Miniimonas arenae]